MNIEVEIRSFIDEEKYNNLIDFFKREGKLVKEDNQETHYFKGNEDLRIQKNNFYSKIWLKKGKIHDDAREEIEIKSDNKSFESLSKLFGTLGYEVEIKWFRDRKEFDWQGIKVTLDYTKGYGYILELEKMSDEAGKERVLEELNQKLRELEIEKTSREEFDAKFEDYKKNWKELTK